MKGGLNKIFRNLAATRASCDEEKRVIKATYGQDSKEPKEKHVIFVIEALRGSNKECTPA
jgi:hypothetical protein